MAERSCKIRVLAGDVVVVGETINADDIVAICEQPIDEITADESGSAGYKCFHSSLRYLPDTVEPDAGLIANIR